MADPTPMLKLLYLGGKRASDEHRDWLKDILDGDDQRKLGMLLASPNTVVLVVFALLGFAVGDTAYGLFLTGGAVFILATGTFIPAFIKMRVKSLTRRNHF